MIEYKFSKERDIGFAKTLRSRVNTYFNEKGISQNANSDLFLKTIIFVGFYFGIYSTILFGRITDLYILFTLWMLLGLGQSVIGMNIMHDKVHGAFSKNKWVNMLLEIPIIVIGVESKIWRIEHNVIHHTYTNIEHIDQDIAPRSVFRFSKNQPRKWFHRFQHIYATMIYSLLVIEWVTLKDFLKVRKYWRMGIIKTSGELLKVILSLILKKLIFYTMFLVVPLYVLNFPGYLIALMFTTMLMVSGLVMTIVFQLAHVVPGCTMFTESDQENKENWYKHQLLTTSNFAMNNKLLTFLLGGLNFQIEHHLFPRISHVHYPKISGIVRTTALEFDFPYISEKTFRSAVRSHYRLLNDLGRKG